ncbi:MAG: hypothetical protein AAGE13_10730 [Pseudomonadota bacterium]
MLVLSIVVSVAGLVVVGLVAMEFLPKLRGPRTKVRLGPDAKKAKPEANLRR